MNRFLVAVGLLLAASVATASNNVIDVESAGYTFGNRAVFKLNGVEVPLSPNSRGLNVVVFAADGSEAVKRQYYDTHGEPADNKFVDFMETVGPNEIVAIAVRDEASRYLSELDKLTIESFGSTRIRSVGHRHSWAMIGQRNGGPLATVEQHSSSSSVSVQLSVNPSTSAPVVVPPTALPFSDTNTIFVHSSGFTTGNTFYVKVDGKTVPHYAGRGFNVIEFGPDGRTVVSTQAIDLWYFPERAADLADYLNTRPTNHWVALGIRDTGRCCRDTGGTQKVPDVVVQAIEGYGSTLIAQVTQHITAFAMVSQRGAAAGNAVESVSHTTSTSVEDTRRRHSYTSIKVHSSGFGFGFGPELGNFNVTVNGRLVPFAAGRGFNVVEFAADGETVLSTYKADLWFNPNQATALANHLNSRPTTSVVAVGIMDTGFCCRDTGGTQKVPDAVVAALQGYGSNLIQNVQMRWSWAMVGRRGTPSGGALEQIASNSYVEIESWRPKGTCHAATHINVQSTGWTWQIHGGGHSVHGVYVAEQFVTPYRRGFNVAVLNGDGSVQAADGFDTHGNPAAADAAAAFIEALPNGTPVIVQSLDAAVVYWNLRLRNAIMSLGATEITHFGHRESYALIGFKGAASGSTLEMLRSRAPLAAETWTCGVPPVQTCVGGCLANVCTEGETLTVTVKGVANNNVYGTGYYTEDSDVAAAAVHAGVLAVDEQKEVAVTCAGPQATFTGSAKNGVTAQDYSNTYPSFRFVADESLNTTPQPPTLPPAPEVCYDDQCLHNKCTVTGQTKELIVVPSGSTIAVYGGNFIYTDDSSISRAAVHAGVLQPGEQGAVKVTCTGPQDSFAGYTYNGVTSIAFGFWQFSFRFETENTPTPLPTAAPNTCTTCLTGLCTLAGTVQTIRVTGVTGHKVWGTTLYTADSHIGVAAVHAGVVALGETKTIVATCGGPQESFTGSANNGITSASYGAWGGSFSLGATDAPQTATTCEGQCMHNKCSIVGATSTITVVGAITGAVWGTDRYTDDSSVQAAAVHMGLVAIGDTATLQVQCSGAADSWTGSTRNGVTTLEYPQFWGFSFTLSA